jgi:hypothetical protein
MPGMLTFDPHGTTGTLEVFDFAPVDTGWWGAEAIVTLTGRDDDGRDFPVSFSFPQQGDSGE